jgi:hypothetical protein
MTTTRFDWKTDDGWTGYYVCNRDCDQSGAYVRAEVAERLLVALEPFANLLEDGDDLDFSFKPLLSSSDIQRAKAAIAAANTLHPPDLGDDS